MTNEKIYCIWFATFPNSSSAPSHLLLRYWHATKETVHQNVWIHGLLQVVCFYGTDMIKDVLQKAECVPAKSLEISPPKCPQMSCCEKLKIKLHEPSLRTVQALPAAATIKKVSCGEKLQLLTGPLVVTLRRAFWRTPSGHPETLQNCHLPWKPRCKSITLDQNHMNQCTHWGTGQGQSWVNSKAAL